ncbi:LOW QUALITY PROTEIN: hypothetical protein V2J09_016710 [Rumex salicifolius]
MVCSTIKTVKYLYKFVYKGHDRVSFNISQNDHYREDEITSYQSGRCISLPEASWRIFDFNLFEMSPATTMLMKIFNHNKDHPEHIPYLYHEFPLYYDKSRKLWTTRKIPRLVARLTYVNPVEGERYYLRLLLKYIQAPALFDDLLTVNGVKCDTFQEAAKKRGLLEDDDYVDSCMEEAKHTHMPSVLRRLFATLLVHCEHVNPKSLWERHYKALSEDFAYRYPVEDAKVLHLTCITIENYLDTMGKSLKHFKMDAYDQIETFECRITRDISDALNAPIPTCYANAPELLN